MEINSYYRKKTFAVAILFLVIGGLNVGFSTMFKKDLLQFLFGKNTVVANIILLLIGFSALAIGFYRDTYLPFLGASLMPCGIIPVQEPADANYETMISLEPGVKAVYWAAEPAKKDVDYTNNWKQAYDEYTNAGVVIADQSGNAKLRVRKPQSYTVPMKGELNPHIHYRVCEENGMIGPVKTLNLEQQKENFGNIVSEQEINENVEYSSPTLPITKNATEMLNQLANETAQNNRMTETGAFDRGADYEGAYA